MLPGLPDFTQSPTESDFVQNPYPVYDQMRALGPLVNWTDYAMPMAVSHAAANAILRDRRFGRTPLEPLDYPPHLKPFYDVDAHSMLELEPPRHTRLRNLVLRAFTSRRIAGLEPEIRTLARDLATGLPEDDTDLIDAYCAPIPVIIIARLLGVPESMAPDLLRWSHAMVGVYQAGRTREMEDAAARASLDFVDFLRGYVNQRRDRPADDLITHLIAAEEDGSRLTQDELISTCILLLNAGHEATVHSMGNAVKTLLEQGHWGAPVTDELVEECLRFDPALHLFTRWAYEDIDVMGRIIPRGAQVGCLLGAAGRCPGFWGEPQHFDPTRPTKPHLGFGAGLHFCIGAPLARLELRAGLQELMRARPRLSLAQAPRYADIYHFHGLSALRVRST